MTGVRIEDVHRFLTARAIPVIVPGGHPVSDGSTWLRGLIALTIVIDACLHRGRVLDTRTVIHAAAVT